MGRDGRLSLGQGSEVRQPNREPPMKTLSKTVAANDTEQQAKLFVALELGQATWVVALHSPIADRLGFYGFREAVTEKLLGWTKKKRVRAGGQPGGRVKSVCCSGPGRG